MTKSESYWNKEIHILFCQATNFIFQDGFRDNLICSLWRYLWAAYCARDYGMEVRNGVTRYNANWKNDQFSGDKLSWLNDLLDLDSIFSIKTCVTPTSLYLDTCQIFRRQMRLPVCLHHRLRNFFFSHWFALYRSKINNTYVEEAASTIFRIE